MAWRRTVFGPVLATLLPVAAAAQGLLIEPIGIDAGDNVVLAAAPAATASPILAASAAPGIVPAALRAGTGKPLPSLILGRVEAGQEEVFGIERLLPATVEQVGFAWDDVAAREALRTRDPELFRDLVSQGHIDPEAALLNRALQTELQRMNCYRSGIDGQWGPGSRRSVRSYFDQVDGKDWPDQQPTNELFREILLNGDVACPAAVAATPARGSNVVTTRRTPSAAPVRRTAPAPAPAPAARSKPKLSVGATGVFR